MSVGGSPPDGDTKNGARGVGIETSKLPRNDLRACQKKNSCFTNA